MDVLNKNFNIGVNQCSPVQEDYNRVVKYDEDGLEYVVYEKVDYPSILRANGLVTDWNLNNLLKAGVNPDFPIHTGMPTRIEGFNVINDAAAVADSILSEENK